MKRVLFVLLTAFVFTGCVSTNTMNSSKSMDAGLSHMVSKPAVTGYDPVSYFVSNKAVRGSGFHTSSYRGQTYLFSSKKNKETFAKNPTKYLPQYGGWCAYGLSVGKKFYSDPTVFAIVKGKLYLNLDKGIQQKWNKDRMSLINKGDINWAKVANKSASEL